MQSKTKIFVLHAKEVIYTGIFILLGILFVILLIIMFSSGKTKEEEKEQTMQYTPGVYTSALTLGNDTVEIEVIVDSDHINSLKLLNMSDAVTTMYPLMQPVFDNLSEQIISSQNLSNLSVNQDNRYTSQVLLNAIDATLSKAKPSIGNSE